MIQAQLTDVILFFIFFLWGFPAMECFDIWKRSWCSALMD